MAGHTVSHAIEIMQAAARAEGDFELARMCTAALAGDVLARLACIERLADIVDTARGLGELGAAAPGPLCIGCRTPVISDSMCPECVNVFDPEADE
jgi:hypothetical protein